MARITREEKAEGEIIFLSGEREKTLRTLWRGGTYNNVPKTRVGGENASEERLLKPAREGTKEKSSKAAGTGTGTTKRRV